MSLRHCPSFIAATPGSEVLIVFVLPDRLLLAVVTRDQADDVLRLAQPLRDRTPDELLAADPANREVPLAAIRELVELPTSGPYEVQVTLQSEKPLRFRFDVQNERDTIFRELHGLLGDRVPFVRQPPSRWLQATPPTVLAGITLALGIAAYRWLMAQTAMGGEVRLPWLFLRMYRTLGPGGIFTLFLLLTVLLVAIGLKRLLWPRRRQRVTAPEVSPMSTVQRR